MIPAPTAVYRTAVWGTGSGREGIVIDAVTKMFGDFWAVDDVSFAIREGEFFSMLGPSGCGKTTTLRMIAGFEEPTDGRILLQGQDVDVRRRRRTAT